MNSLDLDRTQTHRTAESIMSGSAVLSEDEAGSEMLDSYLSDGRPRPSMDESIYESIDEGDEDDLTASMSEHEEDEEYEGDEDDQEEEEENTTSGRVTPPTQDTSAERAMGGNTPRRSARA